MESQRGIFDGVGKKRGFFQTKKGQATAAATLIAIIAGLIVLYILFIPPSERERILEGNDYEGGFRDRSYEENLTLFELNAPRSFLPEKDKDWEKELPTINLYLYDEGTAIKELNSLFVSKNLFSESTATVDFRIDDLQNTKNVLLNFIVEEGKGVLTIALNDHVIFNNEIRGKNINPIDLEEYLQEGINILDLQVSSPGAKFWSTNKYSLLDLSITADLVQREAQESELTFILSAAEKESMEAVRLRFFPNCKVGEVGKLDIVINNHNLFSSIPDCGSPSRPIEFSPKYLFAGENSLTFQTGKGKYLIEQIRLTSDLAASDLPVYYFQLTESQIDNIQDDEANVTLYMRFVDDEELKESDIRINGKLTAVTQRDREFTKTINSFVEEGNNALKIEPIEEIEVVEMKVIYTGDIESDDDDDDECEPNMYKKKCYQGDVWWYDRCGDRYRRATRCSSDEYCQGARCIFAD